MVLGGWNFDDVKSCNLPQKVASAFTAVMGELTGADYMPVAYLGSQEVNGVNYCLIVLQTLVTLNSEKRPVKMIINVSANGKASLVSVGGIAI